MTFTLTKILYDNYFIFNGNGNNYKILLKSDYSYMKIKGLVIGQEISLIEFFYLNFYKTCFGHDINSEILSLLKNINREDNQKIFEFL